MAAFSGAVQHAVGKAIPKTLFSQSGEHAGGLTSCSRLVGQAVELNWVSSLAVQELRLLHFIRPQPPGKQEEGQAINVEQLWQEFMSDPSQWWDNRSEKKSPRSPDFRQRHTKEALWIENWSNPPWVKAELNAMTQGEAQSIYGANVNVHTGVAGQDNNGMAGLNQAQFLVGPQTGCRRSTSTISAAFEREPKVHKISVGPYVDVRALCKAGRLKEFLQTLNQQGIQANSKIYVCALQECINMKDLTEGKQVHSHIMQSGFKPNIFLLNTLVNMYTKCKSVVDARQVFDKMPERDMFTWNTMIAGYVKHGSVREAFNIYEMMQREGVTPDRVTFTCILNASASLGALEQGKGVHDDIVKAGIVPDVILETALLDMYVKSGSMKDACQVFDNMAQRDVVSWSAMIAGYAQHGCGKKAFEIYEQMQRAEVMPNRVTFLGVLNACASLGALKKGKEVHADIMKAGIVSQVNLETALADMYAKCGSMKDARQVFDNMAKRDVVSWNAMIAGCAQHGCGREALQLLKEMRQEGLKPNGVTFICLLSACSHAGLVDAGRHYFDSMSRDHGLTPTVEHFGCMVDLLGRAGRLVEAEDLINKMPLEPAAGIWRALLGACQTHGNVVVAERVAQRIFECDPQHPAAYVLLSNIYAAAGRWDDKAKIRKMMEDRDVRKEPGHSCIEVDDCVHTFGVEDKLHPQIEEIHAELTRLSGQMKEAGYVPDTRFVLHDVEEAQKEFSLCHHSEKLAVAFGIISTPAGMPIHIIKNLRVCGDCHTAMKFISKIVARAVVVRDANRFHHVREGVCSCGDYW